jgi:hypothetical protein
MTPAAPPENEAPAPPPAGSYYYDDATGYETYNPEQDDEDEEAQN